MASIHTNLVWLAWPGLPIAVLKCVLVCRAFHHIAVTYLRVFRTMQEFMFLKCEMMLQCTLPVQLFASLSELHAAGHSHGDMKPANLLCTMTASDSSSSSSNHAGTTPGIISPTTPGLRFILKLGDLGEWEEKEVHP